jgi:hypothetical protein
MLVRHGGGEQQREDQKGITLKDLEVKAGEKTDLQAAQEMQTAKAALFAMFNRPEVKMRA